MTPPLLHVLVSAAVPVLDLDRLTPGAAREPAGRPVWVTFVPVGPPDTHLARHDRPRGGRAT